MNTGTTVQYSLASLEHVNIIKLVDSGFLQSVLLLLTGVLRYRSGVIIH